MVRNGSGVICVEKRCFRLGSISPNSWRKSQMHQKHSSATVGAVQFHQQNYTQLHHCCAQLENMLNFYGVRPTPCASTIGVNLLAQEQRVKCWMKSCRPRATYSVPSFESREPYFCQKVSKKCGLWAICVLSPT